MNGKKFIVIAVVVMFILTGCSKQPLSDSGIDEQKQQKKLPKADSILGSYFSPRNLPESLLKLKQAEIDEYFEANSQIGSHVSIIHRWDEPELEKYFKEIVKRSKDKGFKVIFHIDPLTGMTRKAPAPPKSLKGKSFADADVKEGFKKKVLEMAALKPDILGIGVEVNLLLYEKNQKEFDNYVELSKEVYKSIKEMYPQQTVTISFSWDVMVWQSNYNILKKFKDSLDVYSFTTYPNILTAQNQEMLPNGFYSDIRKYLPTERIGISELAWFSGGEGSEETQAEFYKLLPELMKEVNPEYLTQFIIFDFPKSFISDDKFRTLGLRNEDGTPKKAWNVFVTSNFG